MPRNSRRKATTEELSVVAQFSVRELAEARDSESSAADGETVHRTAAQALSQKYKSVQFEVAGTRIVPTQFGSVQVRGRIDAVRKTRRGISLIEIKSRSTLENPPALRAATRQLQLYAELFDTPPDKTLDLELVTVDWRGRIESLPIARCTVHSPLQSRVEVVLSRATRKIWDNDEKRVVVERVNRELSNFHETQLALFHSVENSESPRILISSPPGTGKTRVALYDALRKAMSLNLPILWITHAADGRHAPIDEIERLSKNTDFPLRVAWHTTSERLCGCRDPYACERYRATDDQLFWTGTVAGLSHEACPYRVERFAEESAHMVIADVNYLLFDSPLLRKRCIAIIDEIHNLGRRMRDVSNFIFPREQLAQWISELPQSARRKFRNLLRPEWLGEQLAFDPVTLFAELFNRISEAGTSARMPSPTRAKLQNTDSGPVWHVQSDEPFERFSEWLAEMPTVIGVSGSLPSSVHAAARAVPCIADFEQLSGGFQTPPPLVFVPQLRLRHPVSLEQINSTTQTLLAIIRRHGACCLVFAPSDAFCATLEQILRTRGFSVLLADDVAGDQLTAEAIQSDFLILPIGSRLAESVNPQPGAFSCGVVLSCGYRPLVEAQPEEDDTGDSMWKQEIADAAARIVQAVGRLHRAPHSTTPVYLLDQAFVEKTWREEWPNHWDVVSQVDNLMDQYEH